jgi:energy-coupling factor transport system ATP-binding protein
VVEARSLSWFPTQASLSSAQGLAGEAGQTEPQPLLRELSFSIASGERVLLTGPSGSGKSTLLRAISGVLQQTEAGVFDGELYVRGRCGLLLQDPANSFVASALGSEVAFGPENLSLGEGEIRAIVGRRLEQVALPYGVHRGVNELSGGESQRLALAGVLAMKPKVLLLDEPTSMLDSAAAANILLVIASALIDEPDNGAIIVDHDPLLWRDLVSRVLVLDASGSLVGDVPIETYIASLSSRGESATQNFDLQDKVEAADLGKITALVGPSGAGKTTELLRRLSKLNAANVGWVPQQAEFTVAGNTVWRSAVATVKNLGLDDSLATRLLGQLGLNDKLDQNPYLLSGGELRRLALVGALAHHPSFLILDEPTVGQDSETWQAVAGVILAARRAGVQVTLATHDPGLIALADEVIEVVPVATLPTAKPRAGRVAPLVALAISFGLLAASFAINTLQLGAAALGFEALVALSCWRILPQQRAKRFVPILIALVSIWLSNSLFAAGGLGVSGFERATVVTLRVAFFALPSVVLAGAVNPAELAAALVKRCRLPARPAMAAAAALVRLESIQWQWAAVRGVRRLRGFSEGRGPFARTREFAASLFALLVQSLRSAGDLAVAMQARAFGEPTAKRRTWVKF